MSDEPFLPRLAGVATAGSEAAIARQAETQSMTYRLTEADKPDVLRCYQSFHDAILGLNYVHPEAWEPICSAALASFVHDQVETAMDRPAMVRLLLRAIADGTEAW